MFESITLLSARECVAAATAVHSLRPEWIRRKSAQPDTLFTLGVASYLDVCPSAHPERDYYARLSHQNALLREHFGMLQERLRVCLEDALGAPARYADGLALPGFHILLGAGISETVEGPAHFDFQYRCLPWMEQRDNIPPLSFTLPVALPVAGGGLELWNVTEQDLDQAYQQGLLRGGSVDDTRRYTVLGEHRYQPYSNGTLFLQQQAVLHRVAPAPEIRPDDQRITLQGHGLRFRGEWTLFW